MFRLIAIALVAGFVLLGLLGTEQPTPYRTAGMAMGTAFAADVQVGSRFVLNAGAGLSEAPQRRGAKLAELVRGTPVLALSRGPQGFVRVRDHAGRVGYVPGDLLVPAP